ncbi:hypothetical protein TON_1116 [Thermococcus onnurineus NA1]|uniref:Uncharacterized protein n=1 Tax=Thermococcus onnurineus (strain NA1) TaxID=523850 RepID=B6YWZ1_THEON|nr:hypothetical protein TON_1116 [Thermococcus onnurineus NA1]
MVSKYGNEVRRTIGYGIARGEHYEGDVALIARPPEGTAKR